MYHELGQGTCWAVFSFCIAGSVVVFLVVLGVSPYAPLLPSALRGLGSTFPLDGLFSSEHAAPGCPAHEAGSCGLGGNDECSYECS